MNAQSMQTGFNIRRECPGKASPTCILPRPTHSGLPQHKLPSTWIQRKTSAQATSTKLSFAVRAAETETAAASSSKGTNGTGGDQEGETYEVFIQKPLGIRFGRGRDGGAYVTSVDKNNGNIDERIEVGDKIVQVSASFGEDVWEAGNFGQCMYAIKTRNGDLYFKFQKMNGDMSAFEEVEESEAEAQFRRERAGGNYGGGTKELQLMNFKRRQETDAKRKGLFETGLQKFNKKDIQGALYDFEEVIAMERKPPVTARDYMKVSSLYRVAHYNVACCYSAIDQIEPGLEALDICMQAGFDQFGKVRSDPNLEKLRQSPKFRPLIEKFDEPVIDSDLFKGFKSFFGKKD